MLHHQFGYAFAQMRQEQRTQSGTRSPRVDIAVWATVEAAARQTPVLVVECKAENVDIHTRDYFQGESYARAIGEPCEFLVMHNKRQTSFFRLVRGLPGSLVEVTNLPKAQDWGDAKKLQEIRDAQQAFSRKDFQNLLFECHTILRDVQKANPISAFDTISKILFTKMYVERRGTHGTFTTDYLDEVNRLQLPGAKPVHEQLFDLTKQYYQTDDLFAPGEKFDVAESTFRRIVEELQKFNLSATGDDVKARAQRRPQAAGALGLRCRVPASLAPPAQSPRSAHAPGAAAHRRARVRQLTPALRAAAGQHERASSCS